MYRSVLQLHKTIILTKWTVSCFIRAILHCIVEMKLEGNIASQNCSQNFLVIPDGPQEKEHGVVGNPHIPSP